MARSLGAKISSPSAARISLAILACSLFACTPPANSPSSNLALSVPGTISSTAKTGALNTLVAQHIVVNITGGDIAPVFYSWDGCEKCDQPPPPPTAIDLSVRAGSNRLIQVLVVYSGANGNDIYYGDLQRDLAPGDVTANVPIVPVATSSLQGGSITGRYLDARYPGGGPTGGIAIKYPPPGNKPPMIIETSSIFTGWFNLFALNDVRFIYQLDDGQALFGKAVSLQDLATSPSVMRIDRPKTIVKTKHWGGDLSSNARDRAIYYAGFFGPNVTTERACYQSSAHYDKVPGLFDETGSTLLSYNTSGAAGSSTLAVSGGSVCSASELTNTASQEFASYLAFRPSSSTSWSHNELPFSFYSVFMTSPIDRIDSSYGAIRMTKAANGTDRLMSFQLLPGVNATALDGIRTFKRTLTANSSGLPDSGSVPCAEIDRGLIAGFQAIETMSIPATWTSQTYSLNLPMSSSEVGRTEFAVCPFKGARYFGGLKLRKDWFSNDNAQANPTLQAMLGTALWNASRPVASSGVCLPLTIFESGPNGAIVQGSAANLSLTISGMLFLYSDSACASSLGASPVAITIPANTVTKTIYVKTGSASGSAYSIAMDKGALSSTFQMFVLNNSAGASPALGALFPSWESACSMIDISRLDRAVGAISKGTPQSYNVSLLPAGTAEIRSGCDFSSTVVSSPTISFTDSSPSYNVTDSMTKLPVRVLDPRAEIDVQFESAGLVANDVLGSLLIIPNILWDKPRLWLKAGARYLETSLGGTLGSGNGWLSRVNGYRFTGTSSITLATDSVGYNYINFSAAESQAHLSGFYPNSSDQSSLNINAITGLILAERTGNGRLFSAWDASTHPSSNGSGFSLQYLSSTQIRGYVGDGLGSSNGTLTIPSTAAHVIAFKRLRNTGSSLDTLKIAVNGGSWTEINFTWSTAPVFHYIHFGDSGSSFTGKIYETVLFDSELTDSQVAAIYARWKSQYPSLNLP